MLAIFYMHETSGACAGMCDYNCMHLMDKTAYPPVQKINTGILT